VVGLVCRAAAAAEYSDDDVSWLWLALCAVLLLLNIHIMISTDSSVCVYVPADWRSRHYNQGVIMQQSPGGAEKESSPSGGTVKAPEKVRVEFPETWLWSESQTGYRSAAATLYLFSTCPALLCIHGLPRVCQRTLRDDGCIMFICSLPEHQLQPGSTKVCSEFLETWLWSDIW